MTVWYNWWTASGWYIIDVFQKRCIYILHQAAGAKTLFRSNLEMRLLNITQKKLSSPCSTNWAKMQNTCNDGLGQKLHCTTLPASQFLLRKVSESAACSLSPQVRTNLYQLSWNHSQPPKHSFPLWTFSDCSFSKFPKECFYSRTLLVMEILFPPTKLPHFKAHTFGCRCFFSKSFCAGFCVKRNTQCCWILLKSLFKRGWRGGTNLC